MTTTPTFTYNRNQIILRSLRQCGAIASGETPGAQEVSDACDVLNAMVSEWQASGLHLWKEKEATLFLQPNVYNYGLGATGAAGAVFLGFIVANTLVVTEMASGSLSAGNQISALGILSGTTVLMQQSGVAGKEGSYILNNSQTLNALFTVNRAAGTGSTVNVCSTPLLNQSTITGNGLAAGVTAIPVASVVGMLIGDFFGVMTSANYIFWSTVVSIVGLTVNIAAPLPASVNPSAVVFDYTINIVRPLRVLNVRRILWSSMIETMVTQMARFDYRNQPDKTTTGVFTQYFYDPQLGTGQFWAWPNPLNSLNGVRFTYMEPIFDFNTAADYPDFPVEWINCLVWNLSDQLGIEYDIPDNRAARIAQKAAASMDVVMGFDREPESFYVGVNWDQTSR